MSRIIQFWLEPNDKHLHKDFIMHIPLLDKHFLFDTYYFWDGGVLRDNYKSLAEVLETHLKKCGHTILSTSKTEGRYIPVDFSDQYYGCFYANYLREELKYILSYVIVENQFATNINEDETDIELVVTNQKIPIEFSLSMTKEDVLDSFKLIPSVLSNKN